MPSYPSRRRVAVHPSCDLSKKSCLSPSGWTDCTGGSYRTVSRAVAHALYCSGSGWPRPQRGSAPRPKRPGHPPAPSSSGRGEVCASAPKSFSGVSPSLYTIFLGSFLPVLRMQTGHSPSGKCKTEVQARGDLASVADSGHPFICDAGFILTFTVSRVRRRVWDSIISIACDTSFRRRKRYSWFPKNWCKSSSLPLGEKAQNPNPYALSSN